MVVVSELQRRLFSGIAGEYENTGDVLRFEDDLDSTGLRELCDAIAERCGGRAAVLRCMTARGGCLRRSCAVIAALLRTALTVCICRSALLSLRTAALTAAVLRAAVLGTLLAVILAVILEPLLHLMGGME